MNDGRNQGLYPKETIATLLNISERRIEQLVKQKIIPKAGRGVFDLGPVACTPQAQFRRMFVTGRAYVQEQSRQANRRN